MPGKYYMGKGYGSSKSVAEGGYVESDNRMNAGAGKQSKGVDMIKKSYAKAKMGKNYGSMNSKY